MKNRVFREEELGEMGKRTVDLLTEAIEAGDKERAKKLANRMYREFSVIHDLYRDWLADMMDYVYRSQGEDELYRALRKTIGATLAPIADLEKADFRRRVEALATILRGHLVALELQEDDEKVCIKMKPCSTGQRLLETGSYDPPRNLAMIEKPHVMTWGLAHFPIYCAHAPVMELLIMERLGWPVFVILPETKVARQSCAYCLYKNAEDIPDEVFARLGKRKTDVAQAGKQMAFRKKQSGPGAGSLSHRPGIQS
jgi:hypothetical protein